MKVTINAVFEGTKEDLIAIMNREDINIQLKHIVLPELKTFTQKDKSIIGMCGNKIKEGDKVCINPGEFGQSNADKLHLDGRVIGESGEVISIRTDDFDIVAEVKLDNKKYQHTNIICYGKWLELIKKK